MHFYSFISCGMNSCLPFSTLIPYTHAPYPPKPLNVHVLSLSTTNTDVTNFTNYSSLWVSCSLHLLPSPLSLILKLPIRFQFRSSVVSDSLQPHGLQHTRPPCPSPTPGACSNSRSLSWWYHPTTSSFVISSHPAFNLSQRQGLFQWVSSLYPEKAMAPHSSTLAWKIPWMEESGRLQSMGLLRVRHDWATSLSLFTFMHWRRKWQPIPVFLPGESQGWGSLVGCRLWSRTESNTTEET